MGHFINVGDPGARRTNLVEATPVWSGAGKGGQSSKGSQGLADLLGVDGRLGRDGRVSSVWSRREGREGWVDPGEARVSGRWVTWVAPSSRILGGSGMIGAPITGTLSSDGRHFVHLGLMSLCIGFSILPPAEEKQDEEGDDNNHR